MNTLEVLDRPIAFQRAFVRITGSINAALMLSQAVYWAQRVSLEDGWFYKTQAEWEDETGLTRREQDGARKVLLDLGLLREEKRGVPRKIFYQVQADQLKKLCTKPPDCKHDRCMGVGTKPPDCRHQTAKLYAPNRQAITETTQRLPRDSFPPKGKPSVESPTDPRFTPFREAFSRCFAEQNVGVSAPWDAKESANLSRWLKKNPTITGQQWQTILNNRAASPVNQGLELSAWLSKALGWLKAPATEFGRGIGNGTRNKIAETGQNLRAALAGLEADHAGAGGDGLFPAGGAHHAVPHRVLEAAGPGGPARRAREPAPPG